MVPKPAVEEKKPKLREEKWVPQAQRVHVRKSLHEIMHMKLLGCSETRCLLPVITLTGFPLCCPFCQLAPGSLSHPSPWSRALYSSYSEPHRSMGAGPE
jgi:hypothetical protein